MIRILINEITYRSKNTIQEEEDWINKVEALGLKFVQAIPISPHPLKLTYKYYFREEEHGQSKE